MDIYSISEKIKYNFFVFISVAIFMICPDLLFGLIKDSYIAGFDKKAISIAVLLAFFISISKSLKLSILLLILLFVFQSTQMAHYQYFGVFYSAFDIALMNKEVEDTFIAVLDSFVYLLIPVLISFVFFIFSLIILVKSFSKMCVVPYASVVMVLALCIPLIQSLASKSSQKFQPNIAHIAVKNGLYSYSYFFAREIKQALGKGVTFPEYEAYVIEAIETKKPNIVMLMGESTSYVHMGLFGYERDTTPDLEQYADSESFLYLPAISSAVSTRVSLALFYNIMYEPNNIAALSKMEHSLYRLAKQQGYDTYYVTTQNNAGGLTYSFSMNDIDVWLENEHLKVYEGDYDNRLLLELKNRNIDFSKPNFITLHMRSAHGPYIANYPRDQVHFSDENVEYHEYMLNTYDNSIVYTQKVIADIYEYFDSIDEPVYIFFTPDHGEVLNVDGRYGHNSLYLDNAKVPFLFYGNNIPDNYVSDLKNRLGCLTNHYFIGKEIARLMGYEITNPNEVEDQFYMNGVDVFGEAGYLPYKLSEVRQQFCIQ